MRRPKASAASISILPSTWIAKSRELCLLEEDWTSRQRDLGLPVIRSQGRYVDKDDHQGLKLAFTEVLASDVVRVISLHTSWLRTPWLDSLLAAIEANDSPLAFVLANAMDPLASRPTVEGFLRLTAAASSGGRRVELLRTDLAGIGFAAHGGALGTIGLGTSNRHHGLGLNMKQLEDYKARQRWPLVLTRPLMPVWPIGKIGVIRRSSSGHVDNRSRLAALLLYG